MITDPTELQQFKDADAVVATALDNARMDIEAAMRYLDESGPTDGSLLDTAQVLATIHDDIKRAHDRLDVDRRRALTPRRVGPNQRARLRRDLAALSPEDRAAVIAEVTA